MNKELPKPLPKEGTSYFFIENNEVRVGMFDCFNIESVDHFTSNNYFKTQQEAERKLRQPKLV